MFADFRFPVALEKTTRSKSQGERILLVFHFRTRGEAITTIAKSEDAPSASMRMSVPCSASKFAQGFRMRWREANGTKQWLDHDVFTKIDYH